MKKVTYYCDKCGNEIAAGQDMFMIVPQLLDKADPEDIADEQPYGEQYGRHYCGLCARKAVDLLMTPRGEVHIP